MIYMKGLQSRVSTGNYTDKAYEDLVDSIEKAQYRSNFPQTIVFDWNGTIDSRGIGSGIPLKVLERLKNAGITVVVYTSSVLGEDKLFMRQVLTQRGIPYTDKDKILSHADMFVGDKNSDKAKAGYYGCKFIHVDEFDEKKILQNFDPKDDRPWTPNYHGVENSQTNPRAGDLMNPETVVGGGGKHSTANVNAPEKPMSKQYPDIGPGIGVMYGQSVNPGAQGGQYLPQKPLEPTATIGDDNQGAGTEPVDQTYPYPPNPSAMQGPTDEAGFNPVIMPKLQASGDPASTYGIQPQDTREQDMLSGLAGQAVHRFGVRIGGSATQPGMSRTPVGDKWEYDYDLQHYTENGVPYLQAAVPAHWDLLDRAFGTRNFIRNDIAAGLDRRRFENKMSGEYVEAEATPDGTIQANVFDRTQRLIATLPDWASMQMYLQQAYPLPNEDMLKSMEFDGRIEGLDQLRRRREDIANAFSQALPREDTHEHFAGEYPSQKAQRALSAIDQKIAQGHQGSTVFLNQNPSVALDAYDQKDQHAFSGAVANYPPDSYVVARTNYTMDEAKANPKVMDSLSQEVQGNQNVHDLTVGSWTGDDGKVYVDYGVVVSGKTNATNMARQWNQQGVFQLKDAQGNMALNYLPTQQEESYNVGLQGITVHPPVYAGLKPGFGQGVPPDRQPEVHTHEHYAGEYGQTGKPQGGTTTMDTEAYQKLRSRGLNDTQARHAMLLMQSTGVPAEQLQQSGLMAVPQMEEGRPVTSGAGTHGHYPGDPQATTQGQQRHQTASRVGAVAGIGGAAALGAGMLGMSGQHKQPTPIGQQLQQARPTGPHPQSQQQLAQQSLMQARQSVGAPVTGRPQLQVPGMHGQAVTSPTGLAPTTGKPIVPPHGAMFAAQSPYSTEEGNEGNETLNPDGTIETGRTVDAMTKMRASFRKFSKVENNGT